MPNLKNTLNELKDILNTIKVKQDAHTAWTGSEKADIEKRIAHVYKKSSPRHTNLTTDLDTDLTDLENIDQAIGQEKLTTAAQIKKLSDEKQLLQSDITTKEVLLKDKETEIANKIILIDKLEKVTKLERKPKKNADGTDQKDAEGNIIYEEVIDLSPIKTILEELKTKGITADLTATDTKIEELKGTITKANKEKGIPAWVGYTGLITGIISFCLVFYNTLSKNKPEKESE